LRVNGWWQVARDAKHEGGSTLGGCQSCLIRFTGDGLLGAAVLAVGEQAVTALAAGLAALEQACAASGTGSRQKEGSTCLSRRRAPPRSPTQ